MTARYPYDTLVAATGARYHYFGNEDWAAHATGLKTVEGALEIRRWVFMAFEAAELCHTTLKGNCRAIDTRAAEVILLEGTERVLPPYLERLSGKARQSLERPGMTVLTNAMVTDIDERRVSYRMGDEELQLSARTKLWAVGVSASKFGLALAKAPEAATDKGGRILINAHLTVPGHSEIFEIGDLASVVGPSGEPLPGVAPVAMQQGRFVARAIRARLAGRDVAPFRYVDKGNLAVIGRNAAVASFGRFGISGFPAWLTWIVVHIAHLIEFDNKMLVIFQWGWNYWTRKRGARLITGDELLPNHVVKDRS